ncbi:DNRLRE domain-containing protein [candidate division KSB1 bacterium]|nr:DNRLRE domain-containing protein [candidate division KSB1 bacterium]
MKNNALFYFIIVILMVIFIAGCEHSKQMPNAYELVENEKHLAGTFNSVIKLPIQQTYYADEIATGYASYLFLGNSQAFQSYILLRFDFAEVPDSSVVRSARLILSATDILGTTGNDFPATMYNVSSALADWAEGTIVWSEFNDQIDSPLMNEPIQISSALDSNYAVSSDTLKLRKDIFKVNVGSIINADSSVDSNLSRTGFCIRADDLNPGNFLVQYHSSESAYTDLVPVLELITVKASSADTTLLTPSHDTFVVQSKPVDGTECLYTGQGSPYRSLLKFDLSDLENNVTINRAYLKMVLNENKSQFTNSALPGIKLFPLVSWPDSPESAEVDSSSSAGTIGTTNGDTMTVEINQLVQDWVAEVEPNYGILVRALDEGYGLYRAAFYGDMIDTTFAPQLVIKYSKPSQAQ